MLSRFACPLAAMGGRSGCTAPSSEGRVLGCVGMLRHGAHLQLPTLDLSAKPLVSGVIQEWYEISRQGSWCQLGNHSTTQNTTDFIHCLVPACFPCTIPALHLIPVGCSSLCSPPTPGRRSWLGPGRLHGRNDSTRQGENWQPAAEK